MIRGSVIGTTVGAIPGPGPTIAAVIAYNEEKRWSKRGAEFGTGIDEGISAPEASNNAVVAGALVPALSLGIPGSGAIAVLIGVLISKNIIPGPRLFSDGGPLVLAIFVGLIVCNLFLLFFGIFGIKYFAAILKVPGRILGPFVMLLLIVGAYSYDNDIYHSVMVLVLGTIAYWLDKFKFSTIPVILGFVMGPIIEVNLNRAMLISRGNVIDVITRPITLTILAIAVTTILFSYYRTKTS
jgi:putative tricarboxylic transport membrane protein